MKRLALLLVIALAPAMARTGDPVQVRFRQPSRPECRRLAYRAYLACVAAEKRMLSDGLDVDPSACTNVLESTKRDCGATAAGGARSAQRPRATITIRVAAFDGPGLVPGGE